MVSMLAGAALAGLVGSLHCVGMCGGFAVAVGGRAREALLWHAGRLTTYGLLGGVAGAFGSVIPGPRWVTGVVSTALILWFAAALAGVVPEPRVPVPGVERIGVSLAARPGSLPRFAFGMATGLLPCGLVYAALSIPVALQSPTLGAGAMVLFGLGTLPALAAVALGLHRYMARSLGLRRLLAVGVLLAGLWSIGTRQGIIGTAMTGHGSHGPAVEPATGSPCGDPGSSTPCPADSTSP